MTARATVTGAGALQAQFRELQAQAEQIVRQEVKRAAVEIESGAKRRVSVDRGALRNSITHRVDEDGMGGVVGTNIVYAKAEEYGRRPGSHPPVEPIIAWARRKGFEDPVGAAWAIAKEMELSGTEPRPFLNPAADEVRPQFRQRVRTRVEALVRKSAAAKGRASTRKA